MRRSGKPPPRLAEVVRTTVLSRNMRRLSFGGDALLGFPSTAASANIKFLLAHENQSQEDYIASLLGEGPKPIIRTYTVVDYRESVNELDIDFALHEHAGPATAFALNAKPGDVVGIAGPSQPKLVDAKADWFLIAGDMSAMPAIEANLRTLPEDAKGYVVLEVQHPDDQRAFHVPKNISLYYLLNAHPENGKSPLVDEIKGLEWHPGTPNVWVAGESACVRELRGYFANACKLDRSHRYTSGYWQFGQDEDAFQMVKRQEPDI